MTNYWIWPIPRGNFGIFEDHGFEFMDFNRADRAVQGVRPGDRVAVYVKKECAVWAIVEATSPVRRRDPGTPVWVEESPSRPVEWPFRIGCKLVTKAEVDLRSVFRRMEGPSAKQKAQNGGLGLYLQGVTLKSVSWRDFSLIEGAVKPTKVTPAAPTPSAPVPSAPAPAAAPPRRVSEPKGRVFGAPLNFRELRHEPVNEQGVIYLFGMVARELGFLVESIATGYPDCDAKRRTPGGLYQAVRIEFEFKARNFERHGHDPAHCDLIVCWENDWPGCPVEVLELSEEMKRLSRDY